MVFKTKNPVINTAYFILIFAYLIDVNPLRLHVKTTNRQLMLGLHFASKSLGNKVINNRNMHETCKDLQLFLNMYEHKLEMFAFMVDL